MMAGEGGDSGRLLRVLHVRNFPADLDPADAVDVLRYFGAGSVTTRTRRLRGRGCGVGLEATAEFRTEAEALVSLLRLHQQRLGGRRLRAVFASRGDAKPDREPCGEDASETVAADGRPVEEDVHIDSCPPPSRSVLLRIANAIGHSPKLYIQVLKLMSRLGMPMPFESGEMVLDRGFFDLSEPSLLESTSAASVPGRRSPDLGGSDMDEDDDDGEEEEEEEESELEDEPGVAYAAAILPKRVERMRAKTKTTVGTAKKVLRAVARDADAGVTREKRRRRRRDEDGDRQQCFVDAVKRIRTQIVVAPALVLPPTTTAPAYTESDVPSTGLGDSDERHLHRPDRVEGFGVFGGAEKGPAVLGEGTEGPGGQSDEESGEFTTAAAAAGEFFSRKYLVQNRIPEKDFSALPPFKNYSPGEPTSRLYVKNLAKTTDEDGLRKVFGGYVDWTVPDQVAAFDLKVLKEGRMKGQAFVSLPTIEAAQLARKETNGFILNNKPMVVSFARSSAPKLGAR